MNRKCLGDSGGNFAYGAQLKLHKLHLRKVLREVRVRDMHNEQ